MGLGLALGLAKCGTFVDATVLGLISGFHAIAKKTRQRKTLKNSLHKGGGMGRKMQILSCESKEQALK